MSEVYEKAKAAKWGAPVPAHLKHGPNLYAAKVYGCPCKVCLPTGRRKWKNIEGATGPKSHADRQRALRQRKKGQPVPPGTKHGEYAYRVYGCRCKVCKAATAEHADRMRNRWRETAHGRWTTVGVYETICWPPKNADPDWVCPSCGSSPNQKEVA